MTSRKNEIIATVARAKIELEQALDDLKGLPMNDPLVFGFISRALQNYLQISRATISLLTRSLRKHPEPQVLGWLDGLQTITQRMEHLVEEMKGVPSKSAPRVVFRKVDVLTLIRRACEFYRKVAARKQVRIHFECLSISIPAIWTDRIAVAAIMDNLLSNAVKFSPVGKLVSVAVEQNDDSLICSVHDEGPGVRPENQKRIFLKEARLNGTPGGPISFDGYGLVVAADLVALLGGKIWCDSKFGHGACFSFRLPCTHRAGHLVPAVSRTR